MRASHRCCPGRHDAGVKRRGAASGHVEETHVSGPLRMGVSALRFVAICAAILSASAVGADSDRAGAAAVLEEWPVHEGRFELGQRDHDALFGIADWSGTRAKVNAATDALQR